MLFRSESAEDMVLQAFIGGAKISSEIIKKLYTNSGREVSNRIGLLNKEGFATLSEMAHSLWENQESVFGFELFAAKYGWTPTITNEQDEVIANPQKPWEKCNEVIWDFIREVFKSEMIARAMQQAKEVAEDQVNQVIY